MKRESVLLLLGLGETSKDKARLDLKLEEYEIDEDEKAKRSADLPSFIVKALGKSSDFRGHSKERLNVMVGTCKTQYRLLSVSLPPHPTIPHGDPTGEAIFPDAKLSTTITLSVVSAPELWYTLASLVLRDYCVSCPRYLTNKISILEVLDSRGWSG